MGFWMENGEIQMVNQLKFEVYWVFRSPFGLILCGSCLICVAFALISLCVEFDLFSFFGILSKVVN